MRSHRPRGLFARIRAHFSRQPVVVGDYARARQLIEAIDRGGIPLNAAKVNAIARALGLEVSPRARLEETVQRIRQALSRAPHDEK